MLQNLRHPILQSQTFPQRQDQVQQKSMQRDLKVSGVGSAIFSKNYSDS